MVANRREGQPGFLQVVGSILAAFFGVQSEANRQRDFTRGKALTFVVVGLVMTVVFVVTIWLIVRAVIGATG